MEKEKKKGHKLTKATMKEIEDEMKKYIDEFKDLYEDSIKFLECTKKGAAKRESAIMDAKNAKKKAKWLSTHPGKEYEPGPDVVIRAKRFCKNDLSITEEHLQEIEKMIIGRKYHRPQPKDFYQQEISMSKIVGHEIINCGSSEQTSSGKSNSNGNNETYVGYLIYTHIKDIKALRLIRYSEFKNFDKDIKKIKPPEAVLPPPSSKFGKRNLSEEFITERIEKLGTYLKEITSCDELNKTTITLKFLTYPNPDNRQLEALDMAIHAMRRKYKIWCAEELYPTQEESILNEIARVIAKTHDLDFMTAMRAVATPGGHSAVKDFWEDLSKDKSMVLKQTEGILSIEYTTYKSNEIAVRKRFADIIKPVFDPLQEQLSTAIDLLIQNLVPPAFGGSNLGVDTLTTDFIRVVNSADAIAIPVLLNRSRDTKLKYLDFLSHNIFPEVTEIGQMLSRTLTCDFFKENNIITTVGGELNRFISEAFSLVKVEPWGEAMHIIFSFKESLTRVDAGSTTSIDGLINKNLRDFKRAISEGEFHFCAEAKRVWWNLSRPSIPQDIAFVLGPLSIVVSDYIRKDFFVHILTRFWNTFTDTAWGMFYDQSSNLTWQQKVNVAYEKGTKAFRKSIKNRFIGIICNIVTNLFKLSIIGPLFNETFEKIRDGVITDISKECIDQKILPAFGMRSLFYSVLDDILTEFCSGCAFNKRELIESSAYNLFSGIPPATMAMNFLKK